MFAQTAVAAVKPVVAARGHAGKRAPVVSAVSAQSVGLRRAGSVDMLGRKQKSFASTVAKQQLVKNGRPTRVVTKAMFEVRRRASSVAAGVSGALLPSRGAQEKTLLSHP